MAKAEGVEVPAASSATGVAGGLPMMYLEPEDRQQYEMYKQGLITSNFDQEELMRYAAMAKAEGVEVPAASSATGVAGGLPMMYLEPEDQQQYDMYKQGLITSNFDQEE